MNKQRIGVAFILTVMLVYLTGCAMLFETGGGGFKAIGWPATVKKIGRRMSPHSSWGWFGKKGMCLNKKGECYR